MSLATPTPRRGYFAIPVVESEGEALLREEEKEEASPDDAGAPVSSSHLALLGRSSYQDQGCAFLPLSS